MEECLLKIIEHPEILHHSVDPNQLIDIITSYEIASYGKPLTERMVLACRLCLKLFHGR